MALAEIGKLLRRSFYFYSCVAIGIGIAITQTSFSLSSSTKKYEYLREYVNERPNNPSTSVRIIALCACISKDPSYEVMYDPFGVAMQRVSELIPEIEYAGMHRRMEKEAAVSCEDQLEKWITTRSLQPRQQRHANITTYIEVIYTSEYRQKCSPIRVLNQTLVGSLSQQSEWVGGMHIPSKSTSFSRHLEIWGEVAGASGRTCDPQNKNIIHIYRSRVLWNQHQNENCPLIHYPIIMDFAHRLLKQLDDDDAPSLKNQTVLSMLTRRLSRSESRRILDSKSKFCVLRTLTTFQPRYDADALVRHALCRLLTKQYKPCHAIYSWKGGAKKYNITNEPPNQLVYKSQRDYKFVITMPNRFQEGYIAEKTLNPYIANSVAVTSIPKIGKYVNAMGMLTCEIQEDELEKVRIYYRGNFDWMPFNTTPDMWGNNVQPIHYDPYENNMMGDEPVLEFATKQWEATLQPCIDEIIRVDQDDDAYMDKLMQPYILNEGKNSLFDGTYVATSLLRWFAWANSPLVSGLEHRIANLECVQEQTPGWGTP